MQLTKKLIASAGSIAILLTAILNVPSTTSTDCSNNSISGSITSGCTIIAGIVSRGFPQVYYEHGTDGTFSYFSALTLLTNFLWILLATTIVFLVSIAIYKLLTNHKFRKLIH